MRPASHTSGPLAIISTLPAGTSIVFALGLQGGLRGVSHECEFPAPAKTISRILKTSLPSSASSNEIDALVKAASSSGEPLYTVDSSLLASILPPTGSGRLVVLTQDLCDVCAPGTELVMRALERLPPSPSTALCPLKASSLEGLFKDISAVAEACGVREAGVELCASLSKRVDAVKNKIAGLQMLPSTKRPRVACVEWLDPLYNAVRDLEGVGCFFFLARGLT